MLDTNDSPTEPREALTHGRFCTDPRENGSGMCSNICRNSSAERDFGSRFRFRTFFYAHEAHGIELIRDNLPAHRGVKQDTHQILEMGLVLTRKREPLQPVFDRKRFDLVERALGPFWLYVIPEP